MPHTSVDHEDAALVAAVVRGDKNAFRELIHKYQRLVISIVYKMIPHKEDSEDLCQDIFMKVYEKLPGFRFQSKLSTWIGSIAFNTCLNFLKKRKLLLPGDLHDATFDENSSLGKVEKAAMYHEKKPDELLIEKEQEEMLRKNMDRLPVIQKTVLHLFHHNEYSLEEITIMTGLTINTVKSHLFRGRKQLKDMMGNY